MEEQIQKTRIPTIKLHIGAPEMKACTDYARLRRDTRSKISWSSEELSALVAGVECHGLGNWTEILTENSNVFKHGRRPVDLLDKYRQYSKTTSFYRTPKKNWVEVDESGMPKTDSLGEIISYAEKFPYDAASKFAKKLKFQEHPANRLVIRDAEDISNVHMYSVSFVGDKPVIRKIVHAG